MKILAVDDDVADVHILSRKLKDMGLEADVYWAQSA